MLQVQGLQKTYGVATILGGVSFVLNPGEHVGLVGPNGAGKSTLLRCLIGEERPDAGAIVRSPPELRVGYLAQSFDEWREWTVGQVMVEALGEWQVAATALAEATERLALQSASEAAFANYQAALDRFEALGGYGQEARVAAVLDGLGLGDVSGETLVKVLSGGQKTRLGLATLLLQVPEVLLLDEPTNHLDVDGLEWLEAFLRGYRGAILIVSHDREFLDQTVERILFLDPQTGTTTSYPGSFSRFAEARAQERARHLELWKRQQEYVERVENDVHRLKGEAAAVERAVSSRQPHVKRLARKKARLATSRERKLERFLDSDEALDAPERSWSLRLDFGEAPAPGRLVLRLEDLAFGYPDQPDLFQGVNLEVQAGQRLAVVGPNGAGKTTLLRLIEGRLLPRQGRVTVGASVRLGTLAQEGETLRLEATVLETALAERALSETEARNFLHYFLFAGDDVFRPVAACSLGERARLQLARLVLRGCNFLVLDEPLNHLDVEGREHFEAALRGFPGTVIAVAHDRAFLRGFARRIVEVRARKVRVVEGGYGDYLREVHDAVSS